MEKNLLKKKLILAIGLLTTIVLFGTIGYHYFSNYNWLDAIYMTVITVSTVGFKEVNPTDSFTKIFTIVLISSSALIFAYTISLLTQYLTSFRSLAQIRKIRMKKQIQKLSDHIIICGYGKNGKQAVKKFELWKRPFVVIEQNEDLIKDEKVLYLIGNASDEQTLLNAGVSHARYLISALPNDADNLFIVLSARQLNKTLTIVSRISQESSESKLRLAGADHTVMPDKIGGDHMASLLTHPDLTKFLENITSGVDYHINIEELLVNELPHALANKTIIELNLRQKTGCNVIAYKPKNGNYIINPDSDTRLEDNSRLVVLGRKEQIAQIHKLLNIST